MRLFYLKDVRRSCYCTRYTSSQNSAGDILHIRVFASHLVVRSNKISTLVNCQLVTLIYSTTLFSIILSSTLWIVLVILINCSLTFSFFNIQSNLCTAATLETPKKWPLFPGGRYTEVDQIFINQVIISLSLLGLRPGRCWQVVVVQRWSLAQVWLYYKQFPFLLKIKPLIAISRVL
jgi:hypothetical protein